MKCEKIKLADRYSFLKDIESQAEVEVYVQEMPKEMYQPYKKPAIVVCPGSGYLKCASREAEPVAIKLLAMDFNVFVITYSCSPARYPIQLLEVAALFDLIHRNKDEWNVDVERIGIMGFSAGGHLAALYSTDYDCDEIRAHFELTYKPVAAILCYPVISADKTILTTASFENLIGHHPVGEEVAKYSCEYHVNEHTPPTFIWHTADDTLVFVENSLRYALALSRNQIPYTLHVYPYGEHGLSTADKLTNNNMDTQISYTGAWLEEFEKWANIIFHQ